MGVVVEVPDILVVKNGVFHSLRDQKIVKDGVLQNFGAGSGVAKDGNLYVLGGVTEQSGKTPDHE